MSTVDIVEETPTFTFKPTLPRNVTLPTEISTDEFAWLCILCLSLMAFSYLSLKRKA